jgi:hypothetical protein
MPQATRKIDTPTSAPPSLKGALDLWHKRCNMISGEMTLCYGKPGIKRETLRSWVVELRHLADGIEKFI